MIELLFGRRHNKLTHNDSIRALFSTYVWPFFHLTPVIFFELKIIVENWASGNCPLSGVKRTWPMQCKCPLMTQSGHVQRVMQVEQSILAASDNPEALRNQIATLPDDIQRKAADHMRLSVGYGRDAGARRFEQFLDALWPSEFEIFRGWWRRSGCHLGGGQPMNHQNVPPLRNGCAAPVLRDRKRRSK
jgi:hypothetical protein